MRFATGGGTTFAFAARSIQTPISLADLPEAVKKNEDELSF